MLTSTYNVASLAEAWIEILLVRLVKAAAGVASLAEAWIEIAILSPPFFLLHVASLAEAWIEIKCFWLYSTSADGRLPRGGVD